MPSNTPHFPCTIASRQTAVEKVIRHMKTSLVEWDVDVSLAALARVACYSESHLIEVFMEVTDTTPHHFLASLRIQKAKELLLHTRKSATEIALDVGYQSFPTFSRTFKDYVGMTPARFRAAPRTLSPAQLAELARAFIARNQPPADVEHLIEGTVHLPASATGVIFVGTFTQGVPQGIPFSGTVLLHGGPFRLRCPARDEFHLLAALVAAPASVNASAHHIEPSFVASHRVRPGQNCPRLTLRPMHLGDPPLVVSLLGLLHEPEIGNLDKHRRIPTPY